MDDIRIYNRALSEDEIKELYNLKDGSTCDSSKIYAQSDLDSAKTDAKSEQKIDCKENPSECGIIINTDSIYSKEDLDSAKDNQKKECKNNPENCGNDLEAKYQEGKDFCTEYPLSCNVKCGNSDTQTLTKKTLEISSNWQMLGLPIVEEMKLSTIFPNEAEGALIWQFKNNGWYSAKLKTENGKFISTEIGSGTAPIDKIDFGSAIWIKPKTPFTLEWSVGGFESEYEDMRDNPLGF